MIPAIRFYLEEDFDNVVKLLKEHEYPYPESKDELNGVALVAHDSEGKMAGFVWALAAENIPVSYFHHFVIRRDMRDSSFGSVFLFTLMKILGAKGVRNLVGVVPPGHSGSLKRLRKHGIAVIPNYSVVSISTNGES